jgi:hypothetical protein
VTRPPSLLAALTCALALGALTLCAPLTVFADDAPRPRVLLVEHGRDPFLERVGAEIEALGFVLDRSDTHGQLETAARTADAVAAIRMLPSRKGVEVWMADSTSGRSLLRQVIVDESPGGPDRDVVALQTAELLRTSLLGEKSEPASTQGAAARQQGAGTSDASDAVDGSEDTGPQTAGAADTALQLGFGALLSPGGASASATLGLSLQHFFARSLGLGLDFMLPVLASSIDELEGSAAFETYLAGATLLWRLAPDAPSWFANAGAGAGLLLVRYDGDAAEPLRARSGARPMGATYAHGDVGLALASWLRVGLRALIGVSFERVTVTFAGNSAGSYGPALLAGSVFAGVHWP